MAEIQDAKQASRKLVNLHFYLRQRPVMLGLLSALAVIFFLVVTGLSNIFYAQRQALGDRWFNRGVSDLEANRYQAAVTEFRSALLYSRDDSNYQLNLAEALLGANQTPQAYSYLLNLWDREPENGQVNLELARIEASKGQPQRAVRYYHDAVYAVWPSRQEPQRLRARLELVDLLLGINAKAQAQAELIALWESVGEDASEQVRLGDLFMRAGDYERGLAAYRVAVKADRHNPRALAGAGYAAFMLAQYPLAEQYLEGAAAANPNDRASGERLKITEMVIKMDPYRSMLSVDERNHLVMRAFATAGQRLTDCAVPNGVISDGPMKPSLGDRWTAMKPQITLAQLATHPDLADKAMDLIFLIEKQGNSLCGTPTGADLALLLIAKLHEGN